MQGGRVYGCPSWYPYVNWTRAPIRPRAAESAEEAIGVSLESDLKEFSGKSN
jgi:hypothetical protein